MVFYRQIPLGPAKRGKSWPIRRWRSNTSKKIISFLKKPAQTSDAGAEVRAEPCVRDASRGVDSRARIYDRTTSRCDVFWRSIRLRSMFRQPFDKRVPLCCMAPAVPPPGAVDARNKRLPGGPGAHFDADSMATRTTPGGPNGGPDRALQSPRTSPQALMDSEVRVISNRDSIPNSCPELGHFGYLGQIEIMQGAAATNVIYST